MIDNVTVIIRSANERTTMVCEKLISKEVSNKDIFVINEKPFSNAVKKTFEIGLKQGKKWTLAIDADLIITPGSIKQMVISAEKQSSNLYVYQGLIIDKFSGKNKYGGPHLYLTNSLENVNRYYNDIENVLRPESFLYEKMRSSGYEIVVENKLFALHDFHQSYNDIYRKAFFHGIKHPKWSNLFANWLEKGKKDIDFRIFSSGFIDGYYSDSKKYPSIDILNKRAEKVLKNNSYIEKQEFENEIYSKEIADIIKSHDIELNDELMVVSKKTKFINKIKNRVSFLK